MKQFFCGLLLAASSSSLVFAADDFVISDIKVEGLKRLSAGSVFKSLPLHVGDKATSEQLAKSAKALFKTGYFRDINMAHDGSVLIIKVEEQPSISSITIEGNHALKTDDLKDGLKKSGLEEGQIFQQATLDRISLELERQYVAQGRYNASVKTDVQQQDNNRVALAIHIKEGKEAAVRDVNIVGNTVFSDKELLEKFELRPPEMLPFYKSALRYSKEKAAGDIEKLRSFYLDQGYINFQVTSTQVSISQDKKDVFITINVSEGGQYKVSDIKLSGDLIVPEEELRKLIQIKPGEVFSRQKITKSTEALTLRLGNEGYTFANINASPELNDTDHTAVLTFSVDPGKRAYVRRVDFHGNTKTEDEVLRRELRQFEGASASTDKIDKSKERMQRLPYIKSVNVEQKPVAGTDDQLDVDYNVEEQPSGAVTASVGYGQTSGLVFGSSVTQENWLGTGNHVGINFNKSSSTVGVGVDYLNPYYTDDGVSRGFNAFYTKTDFKRQNLSDYSTDRKGGGVNFGYPFSEIDRLNFGVSAVATTQHAGVSNVLEIIDWFRTESASNTALFANASWSRSTLNKAVLATKGMSQVASLQTTMPGSDTNYYQLEYKNNYYVPFTENEEWVLHLKGNAAYEHAFGSSMYAPYYDHYYAGGLGSVRGFEQNTAGPRSVVINAGSVPGKLVFNDGDSFGGNAKLVGSAEFSFPIPGVNDQSSMRSYVFFDAGSAFNTEVTRSSISKQCGANCTDNSNKDYGFQFGDLRYSTGIGIDWLTAFGPIGISYAHPLSKKDGDKLQQFQFSLGGNF